MITYKKGDLFTADLADCIVAHVSNDQSAWGAGFTSAIDKHLGWGPRTAYEGLRPCVLGQTQFVRVDLPYNTNAQRHCIVANMVAQHGIGRQVRRVQYDHLSTCLHAVAKHLDDCDWEKVVMPKIGTGLGGGDWLEIEPLIERHLGHAQVTIYEL